MSRLPYTANFQIKLETGEKPLSIRLIGDITIRSLGDITDYDDPSWYKGNMVINMPMNAAHLISKVMEELIPSLSHCRLKSGSR